MHGIEPVILYAKTSNKKYLATDPNNTALFTKSLLLLKWNVYHHISFAELQQDVFHQNVQTLI